MVNEPSVFEPLKFYCIYLQLCKLILRDVTVLVQVRNREKGNLQLLKMHFENKIWEIKPLKGQLFGRQKPFLVEFWPLFSQNQAQRKGLLIRMGERFIRKNMVNQLPTFNRITGNGLLVGLNVYRALSIRAIFSIPYVRIK